MGAYDFPASDTTQILAQEIALQLDQRSDVQHVADQQLPMQDLLNAIGAALGGNQNPVQDFINTWGGSLDWLTDIGANWNSAIQQIVDHISAAVGGGTSGNGVGSVRDNINGLFVTAETAQSQATAAQIAIQQISQNTNAGAGGMNKLITFPTNGAPNTNEWSYNPAEFVVADNMLTLAGGTAVGSQFLNRPNFQFLTDSQAVTAQLGSEGGADYPTYLCLRANANGTQGMAVRITNTRIAIGYYTFTGTAISFVGIVNTDRSQGQGNMVEFRAVADNFLVLINGQPVLTTQYSGTGSNIGSSWRNGAVIMSKGQAVFVYYSFRLSSFGMYDYQSIANQNIQTSWRFTRSTAAAINQAVGNSSSAALPTTFFENQDYAVNADVASLGQGLVVIKKSGFYWLTVSWTQFAATGISLFSRYTIFVNGVRQSDGVLCGSSVPIYLNLNDQVSVGPYVGGEYSQGDSAIQNLTQTQIGGGPGAFFQGVLMPSGG